MTHDRFLDAVLRNPVNAAILKHAGELGLSDWWLTGGATFQTVWNVLEGRDPTAAITDYDLFYFDHDDLSEQGEEAVRERARTLFGELGATVEICNEARVHLWYEHYFDVPIRPFIDSRDAINHFISPVCMYAVTRSPDATLQVYAPHGYADLFNLRVRPNPIIARADVYESKTSRWLQQWPRLTVDPWPR